MTPNHPMSNQKNKRQAVYRFFGGTAVGTFLVAIPLMYGASTDLSGAQITLAIAIITLCGGLTARWGEKFVDGVARLLDRTGF